MSRSESPRINSEERVIKERESRGSPGRDYILGNETVEDLPALCYNPCTDSKTSVSRDKTIRKKSRQQQMSKKIRPRPLSERRILHGGHPLFLGWRQEVRVGRQKYWTCCSVENFRRKITWRLTRTGWVSRQREGLTILSTWTRERSTSSSCGTLTSDLFRLLVSFTCQPWYWGEFSSQPLGGFTLFWWWQVCRNTGGQVIGTKPRQELHRALDSSTDVEHCWSRHLPQEHFKRPGSLALWNFHFLIFYYKVHHVTLKMSPSAFSQLQKIMGSLAVPELETSWQNMWR